MNIELVMPCADYWESYKKSLDEIDHEGNVKGMYWDGVSTSEQYFADALDMREGRNLEGLVPCTNFWIIVDREYVGRMSIRHELNEYLRNYGGHIGYEVKVSARRRGIATKALSLALDYAREDLKLNDVLITCADDNIGSIRAIEKNGGYLVEKRIDANGRLSRFYTIKLSSGL